MFCLNDGGETEVPEKVRVRAVKATLSDVQSVTLAKAND